MSFSALPEDAFVALASLRSQLCKKLEISAGITHLLKFIPYYGKLNVFLKKKFISKKKKKI